MTSSELYHGFGLMGYPTVATRFEGGKIVLEVEATRPPRCAGCQEDPVTRHDGMPVAQVCKDRISHLLGKRQACLAAPLADDPYASLCPVDVAKAHLDDVAAP